MRDDLRHYIDTSMNKSSSSYELLGDGIESLTEEMNPEEETKHYINMKKASNKIKSYQRSFEVDKEDCIDDAVQTWIDGLVDKLPVGGEAVTSFIRFRLKDVMESEPTKFKAIKVPCTVAVSSSGGDGGDYIHNVLSVKQAGDDVEGIFDISTKAFVANS